ncbi:MAG: gamma-glutamylcyclotransferase [Bacteroidales bacterium]|nr:gamma-glutamylcyclotransferase [Bacteroidales bacterium]
MDKVRMNVRGVSYTSQRSGTLRGFRLTFNKKASKGNYAFANIIESENDLVEGILYELPDTEIEKLDKVEGFPNHYIRTEVTIYDSLGTPIQAITYIANPTKIVEGLFPQKEYMDHLLAGKDFLSRDYFNMLKGIRTC